jgi:hypothetical protein
MGASLQGWHGGEVTAISNFTIHENNDYREEQETRRMAVKKLNLDKA